MSAPEPPVDIIKNRVWSIKSQTVYTRAGEVGFFTMHKLPVRIAPACRRGVRITTHVQRSPLVWSINYVRFYVHVPDVTKATKDYYYACANAQKRSYYDQQQQKLGIIAHLDSAYTSAKLRKTADTTHRMSIKRDGSWVRAIGAIEKFLLDPNMDPDHTVSINPLSFVTLY